MQLRSICLTFFCLAAVFSSVLQAQENSEASRETFTVSEYRVLGNTVLPAMDIEAVVYPHLGADKTIADVETVRQALEKLYKDKGYGTVYVDIPDQTVNEGIVRLKITEGRLDRLRITGARYFSNGRIRERLSSLESGTVMNLPELQTQLGQLNQESRDRLITPVLKAGRTSGTVDVELKVQDNLPVHGSVEVNDRYTANTTRTRASINLSYDNLWQRFHSLSLQYQTTPEEPEQTQVLAATYLAPVTAAGNMVAVYAVDTNSDFAVVSTGGDLSVLGAGNIYGARYIVRLPQFGAYAQTFTIGADYKDFADNIRLTDGTTDTTPIQYLVWSAAYGGAQTTQRSSTSFNLGVNTGFRGVVNDQAEFSYKRYNGKASFAYLRGDLRDERPLLWGSSLSLRLAGQWAASPLISNEQFSIGGAETVRGYLESTQLGDLGVSGSLEWRSPSLHRWLGTSAQRLVAFGFFDAGVVSVLDWIESRDILQEDGTTEIVSILHDSKRFDLASAGAGLRFSGLGGFNAALDWAYPLRSSDDTAKGDSRIHFQVRYGF